MMFINGPSGYPLHGNAARILHASPGIEVFIITLCAVALVTCVYWASNKRSKLYLPSFLRTTTRRYKSYVSLRRGGN